MSGSLVTVFFQLLTVLVLVLVNGFFVAAEFSLVRVRRSRIEEMVDDGHRGARRVASLLADLGTVIAATQLGVTMASLGLGWLGEPFVAHLIESWLSFLPEAIALAAGHTIAVVVAFVSITYVQIVLGELAPKSFALQRTETTAFAVSSPMLVFSRIFRPFLHLLTASGNALLHLVGIHTPSDIHEVHSEDELRIILEESQESGVLEEEETEIIQRVLDFTDTTARQIMVPRREMVCIPLNSTLSEVLDIVLRAGYGRYPVYKDGLDDIVGVVQIKDIMPALCNDEKPFDLPTIMRTPLIAPENIPVADLLEGFRRQRTHMAVLVDEFGGTAGLVTMQDLLDEIVGEVAEELGENEVAVEPQADGSILVNGKILLVDVNREFGLKLSDPHYITLGGLVFSQIGRRPRVGDAVDVDGAHLQVEALDGLRVALVRVMLATTSDQTDL